MSLPVDTSYDAVLARREAFIAARREGKSVDKIVAAGRVTDELPIARIQEVVSAILAEIGADGEVISGFTAELGSASSVADASRQVENLTSLLSLVKGELAKLEKESAEKKEYLADRVKAHERLRTLHAAALESLKKLKDKPPSNIYGLEGYTERSSRYVATQSKHGR